MNKKKIMVDMDEVIVKNRFTDYLNEFLNGVDFEKLNSFYRQDLIKGREEEFKKIYQFKNLYKNDNGTFVEPLENCVEVLEELNKYNELFIVTSYIWKKDIFDASTNLKNKYEYLKYFLQFINPNNFIFITDKSKIKFDIGIDDRPKNLVSCNKKILFTEFRNKNISEEELAKDNIIRADNWTSVRKILTKKYPI